jgi:fatty-acyl-CoA synthase
VNPKSYIVAKENSTPSAEDIIAFTKEHLALFRAPKAGTFGELPETAAGKI